MIAIRPVFAFALLVIASTAAQAGLPAAAPAGSAAAGIESTPPRLDLGLDEVNYGAADGQARTAPSTFADERPAPAPDRSLAHYLNAPAPYGRLLPQSIDDRGIGYRLWF